MKAKRRQFLKRAISGALALGLLPATSGIAKAATEENKNFMHVVFFWLKNPDDQTASQKFEQELRTLTENIEVIQSAHLGNPASTDRPVIDNTYTYSLILSFKNKADQDIYQQHPIHLKFIENASHLWEKVVVYDSETI